MTSGFRRLPDGVEKGCGVGRFVRNGYGGDERSLSARWKRSESVMVRDRDTAAGTNAKWRANVYRLLLFCGRIDTRVRRRLVVTRIRKHHYVLTRLSQHEHDIKDECKRQYFHFSAINTELRSRREVRLSLNCLRG